MNSRLLIASLQRTGKEFHGKEYGGIVGDLLTTIEGDDEKTTEVADWMCDTYKGVMKMREDRDENKTANESYIIGPHGPHSIGEVEVLRRALGLSTKNGSYIRADAVNFTDEPAQIDMDGEAPRSQDVNPAFPMKKRPQKNTGTPSAKPLAYGADEGGKKDYHDWEEYKSALKTRIDMETGYPAETEASGGNDGVVRLMVGDYDLTGTLYYNAEEGWLCHSWNAIYTPDDGEPQDAGSLSCTYGDLDDALSTLKQSITILEGGE